MQIDKPQPRPVRVLRKVGALGTLKAHALSRTSLLGDVPVVVSLTSYGPRLKSVGRAIESLAAGTVRAEQVILWVSDRGFQLSDYPDLVGLVRRGLEVRECEDFRSFKKFYPYAIGGDRTLALVTADDDILYPRRWLEELMRAHDSFPGAFVGLRGASMSVVDGRVVPYGQWERPKEGVSPSTFLTTGAGAVFPPRLLDVLAEAGSSFLENCPSADDIWVNLHALRAGVDTAWWPNDLQALSIPGSQQLGALHSENVTGGRNDEYVRALFTREDISRIDS